MRKLGRRAEPAVFGVEPSLELRERRRGSRRGARGGARRGRLEARERILELRGLLGDVATPLAIRRGHAREQIEKAGSP